MVSFARAFTAALVCVLALAAPFAPEGALAADKGTIRIGLLAPSTGPRASEGADAVSGFRYFLATHGDRLGGFAVDIRSGDEGDSVDVALKTSHQLVEQDAVDAIVGIISSSAAYGIADYLDEQKKLVIVAGAGADELTQGAARKTFFRVGHTSSQDVMPLGDFACRRAGLHRVAIVAEDAPYGWEAAGGFARAFTDAGCKVVQEQYAPPGSDWSGVVAKIDHTADVVFATVGGPDSPAFLGAYRANAMRVPLFGDGLLTDERIIGTERDTALGVVTALHYTATLKSAMNHTFRMGYESLGGNPVSYFAENGYVAAEALSEALGKLGSGAVKSDALVAAMRDVSFSAPRGAVRFDAQQQVVNDVYIRRVVQIGGRYRNEVIATYPKVSQFWKYDPVKYLQLPPYGKLKGTWVKSS